MPVKKTVIWLVAVNLLLLAVLWGLKIKLDLVKAWQYPAVLTEYSTIGTYPDWVFRKIQPRLTGFTTENNQNYLTVEYPSLSGLLELRKVFATGRVKEGKKIETIFFEDKKGKVISVNFDELKKRLKLKQQIGIEYMASVPRLEDFLGELCPNLPNYCLLVGLINNEPQDKTLYAVKIYLNLQNE